MRDKKIAICHSILLNNLELYLLNYVLQEELPINTDEKRMIQNGIICVKNVDIFQRFRLDGVVAPGMNHRRNGENKVQMMWEVIETTAPALSRTGASSSRGCCVRCPVRARFLAFSIGG